MSPSKGQTTEGGAQTRSELIRVARELVERGGVPAMTFRAVAKDIGISHMAPYRHFKDGPRELLAVVAEEGFRELIEDLDRTPAMTPKERVARLALRYVRFGVERPNLYRALFHEQLADPLAFYATWEREGKIEASSARHYRALEEVKEDRAFGLIVGVISTAQEAGELRPDDPNEFGLALAALAHGLVGEFIDEGLFRRTSEKAPWSKKRREMSRRVIDLMIRGFAP